MRPNMLLLSTIPDLLEPVFDRKEDYTDDLCDMLLSGLRFDLGVGLLSSPTGKQRLWGEHFIKQGSSHNLGCWSTRRRYGDEPSLVEPANSSDSTDAPTIDVYWVSDTGGCLLLIAYMHSQWNQWTKPCQLVRVVYVRVWFSLLLFAQYSPFFFPFELWLRQFQCIVVGQAPLICTHFPYLFIIPAYIRTRKRRGLHLNNCQGYVHGSKIPHCSIRSHRN